MSNLLWFDECMHLNIDFSTKMSKPVETLFKTNNNYVPVPKFNKKLGDQFYQSDVYMQWSVIYDDNKLLCKNCMLSIISHLQSLLEWICVSSTNISKYFYNEICLIHFNFVYDILKYSFVVKYILKHKRLYKPLLDYFMILINMFYLEPKLVSGYYNKIDDDKYFVLNKLTGKVHEIEFILNIVPYFKREHFLYLLNIETKNKLNISIQDLLFNIVLNKNNFAFFPCWEIVKFGIVLKYYIHKYFHAKKYVKCNEQYERFTRNYICMIMCDRLNQTKSDTLKYLIYNRNVQWLLDNFVNKYPIVVWRKHLLALNSNKHCKKYWVETKSRIKARLRCNIRCASPQCNNMKYEKQFEQDWMKYDARQHCLWEQNRKAKERIYILNNFYRCKQCLVATYCSRHCQKVHWNRYNHKTQCNEIVNRL